MLNIFLDDERFPSQVSWVELPSADWIVLRSYQEFVNYITINGVPKIISFDNDLGYSTSMAEKTGYDCAKWLVDYCLDKNENLPEYYVHSMNPVARDYIKCLLRNFNNFKKQREL